MQLSEWIYALTDPRTSEVRYVGRTIDPKARYEAHMQSRARKVRPWIAELRSLGLRPRMVLLWHVGPDEIAKDWEARWLSKFGGVKRLLNGVHVETTDRLRQMTLEYQTRTAPWHEARARARAARMRRERRRVGPT